MKYSEFKRIMEDAGFRVIEPDFETNVSIYAPNDLQVATVWKYREGVVDFSWESYVELPVEERKFIAYTCMELAFTPTEDREEEKFYYKLIGIAGPRTFLMKFENVDAFSLGTYADAKSAQSTFSDSEFEALPDDIKSHNWEKIKVESEN